MPVDRPVNNISGAFMHSVKRARDSAARRGPAMNAVLGLDNFSRFLRNESVRLAGEEPLRGSSGVLPRLGSKLRNGIVGDEIPQGDFEERALTARARRPLAPLVRSGGSEAAVLALRAAGHRLKETAGVVLESLGKLSALFESGSEGVAAVGYDRVGGTSYGKYQIASNTGSLGEFISFLEQKAPALAKEFQEAGPPNTGSREGRMPEVWRAVASREPETFESLQHEFIQSRFYTPAADRLHASGVDESRFSRALREVLFSTAVQHGPSGAAGIVKNALSRTENSAFFRTDAPDLPAEERRRAEQGLIRNIYSIRQEKFGSSSTRVQEAVAGRLHNEMNMALAMLEGAE